MKKFLTIICLVLATLSLFAEASGTCGENLTWTLDDNGTLTISGTGEMENYNLRLYQNAPWREYRENIKSVIIGNGIIRIGMQAFIGCCNLTSIEIPNSVTSIGNRAFPSCSSLTSITIDSSNIVFDSRDNCNAIIATATNNLIAGFQSTIIPNSVTRIENDAFYNCSSLTSIEIPNSVTSIGTSAFSGCSSLTSIEIPNSVTSIGDRAFYSCSSLTSITVEAGNPKYDSRDNCNAIIETATNTLIAGCKNTIIPNSVTSIGIYAFYGCSNMTTIEIPNSVTSIGNRAFSGCSSLTSIEIPNSVTSIGNSAFSSCSSLTSIEIPNSVISIGNSAFFGCSSLTSIEIPNSVTNIGDDAFYNCRSLTSIEIPNSITSIGAEAFSWCSGLTSIEIPNSVTSIGNSAFSSCSSLTSIEIPNSVTSIGNSAFSSCSSLTSIEIPNSVTRIGNSAFYGCRSLTSIKIPNSVTSIGDGTFRDCSNLNKVTCFVVTPPQIGNDAFNNVTTSNIHLYVPAESVNAYKAADVWKDFDIRAIGSEEFFAVSFVGFNNADLGSQEVSVGDAAIALDPQTPEGYKFIGWDQDFSNVQSDMVVKARYSKVFIGHHGDTEYEYIIRDNCE